MTLLLYLLICYCRSTLDVDNVILLNWMQRKKKKKKKSLNRNINIGRSLNLICA
jgi:hypothetical protein